MSSAEYRFVVFANVPTQQIPERSSKEDVLNLYTFSCIGAWATSGEAAAIPMWGETTDLIKVDSNKEISVSLHRALARVDVGLNFKSTTQGNQSEEVGGLADFKLTSVRVYRTKNKAYAGTSSENITSNNEEVIAPSIPADAKYNMGNGGATNDRAEADSNPLVYQLNSPSNSYVREIYIPESINLPSSSATSISMDEVPCLVIGGSYKGGEETFYRVDFADYIKENGVNKVNRYKEILRNHRYRFNIKSVSSPGFKEPEQALNSISTPMDVNVMVWNDVPLNSFVQGNKYFQIDQREVWLDVTYPIYNGEVFTVIGTNIPFKTNIQLIKDEEESHQAGVDIFKNFKLEWASSGTQYTDEFQALVVLEDTQIENGPFVPANSIVIQIHDENVGFNGEGVEEIKDVLYVTVDNFKFSIHVTQKASNIKYKLLCDEIKVHGKYREGVPLNYTNYLEIKLISTQDLYGEQAELKLISEKRKGIQFSFEGKLDKQGIRQTDNTYLYTIKLQGAGTPTKDPTDPHNPDNLNGVLTRIDRLVINTNSIEHPNCDNTSIIFGYKTKKILAIGANAAYRYGYMLEPNSGSRAFVDASVNFGVDPNSTVTIEQYPSGYRHTGNYPNKSDANAVDNAFHIEYMTANRGMSGERIDIDYLNTMLAEFKPDIILTGQAINYSDEAIAAISDFVNRGGVFLMFNEYYPQAESINKMVGAIVNANLTGENESMTQSQFAFTLPTGSQYEGDRILNGAFGDLRGKTWGADGYFMHGFGGLPADIITYNTRKGDGNPCFFRHKSKPFVFVGDGGFISNAQRYIGPEYQGGRDYFPFAINSAYQPVERTNYTTSGYTVYNSKLFGNILAWAIDYAETHGINR